MYYKPVKNKQGKGYSHSRKSPFIQLDTTLVTSTLFRSLKANSRVVLLELLAQYNGFNNGNLCAPKAYSKQWQLSKTTLYSAINELQQKRLIVKTRQGLFASGGTSCALYAISWLPINYCDGQTLATSYINKPYQTIYQLSQLTIDSL